MWLGLRVLYQHVLSRVTYFYFFYFLILCCRLYLLRENALSLVTYCGFCSGICIFIFFFVLVVQAAAAARALPFNCL
jgi:hypothetical protein